MHQIGNRSPFREGFIKFYEFGFVILASLFANLMTSQTALDVREWWLLRELALLFASWNTFQIYRTLDPNWNEALKENDSIGRYRLSFNIEDIYELRTRLGLVVTFIVEALACTAVRLYVINT